jgi:hypothetical protein
MSDLITIRISQDEELTAPVTLTELDIFLFRRTRERAIERTKYFILVIPRDFILR